MTDLDLKQALAPLFDDEPVHTTAARRADLGRRALRRRRATGLAAGTAVAAVAALGVASLDSAPRSTGDGNKQIATAPPAPKPTKPPTKNEKQQLTEPPSLAPPFREPPASDAALTTACRQSNTTNEQVKAQFFGDGAARLVARADTRAAIVAVYASADGSRWAQCRYALATTKYRTALTVYQAVENEKLNGPGSSSTTFCMTDTDCYDVSWFANKLPEEVAAVRFRYANDDHVETVPTNDGWVAAIHEVPMFPLYMDAATIEYLDASGKVLADNLTSNDASGTAAPGLEEFPVLSLRPEKELGTQYP